MKRKLTAGLTGVSLPIFVSDTSSTSGGGLAGLVFNSSGLVAEYRRQGQSTWTAISLAAGTLGTFVSGGLVADGSLNGAYEFCPPDAAFASGARWVALRLRGATNMGSVLIECELDAVNYQDAAAFGLSKLTGLLTLPAGAAATGTLTTTSFTATGASLSQVTGSYATQFLLFTSGNQQGFPVKINTHTYSAGTHTFGCDPLNAAPANTDSFLILGKG